jgi:hypothetical protein
MHVAWQMQLNREKYRLKNYSIFLMKNPNALSQIKGIGNWTVDVF